MDLSTDKLDEESGDEWTDIIVSFFAIKFRQTPYDKALYQRMTNVLPEKITQLCIMCPNCLQSGQKIIP